MPAKKLSASLIKNAPPKAAAYDIYATDPRGLLLRIYPSGRKTYFCQFRRGKRQRIGDATVITLERAQYRAREIHNEADDHGGALKRDPVKSTLGGFIESVYTPWINANRRRAEKTLSDLDRCFKHLFQKRLTDLARSDLDAYVASRRKEGLSAATIVRNLNNLRSVLRRAVDANYLRENIFRGWEKPKVEDKGVTRYLDADEESRLRAALAERDDKSRRERVTGNNWRTKRGIEPLPEFLEKDFPDHLTPMTLISLNTGLRYGELTGLEWSAIDFRARNLTVTGRTSKGARTRHIPLNAEALDVLTRWRGKISKGLVFSNQDGTRIGTVKTAWLSILMEAKIEAFRWHDLRHTFASKLVQRGVNLAVVRDLLGHGDFALTLRYAHLEPKQKADAVARLAT
jgi:site-specific recombinase XerD